MKPARPNLYAPEFQVDRTMKTAHPPEPPYYAVIFTSVRTPGDNGYAETARRMLELAAEQDGFLGVEAARDSGLGITVSYWDSLEAIARWKRNTEHLEAQRKGRETWYQEYRLRIAKVTAERAFRRETSGGNVK